MREIEINLTLRFKIPESNLNVNGLLYGLKKINNDIMLAVTHIIFKAIEASAVEKLISMDDEFMFSPNGSQRERTLKTSFGDLKYSFAQVRDNRTGQTIVPLREKLKIPKYKRYLNESLEPALGLAIHLSYGRSSKETIRIRDHCASRWTVWRRLHEFSDQLCQFGDMKDIPYTFLMADGTKVHLQERRGKDVGQKELRWAFASTGVGQPFDIVGIWVNKSWKHIANDLKECLNYDRLEVLISDGGPGIEYHLLSEGMRHQRCVFHAKRDFPFILFQDGIKKNQQNELKDLFNSIPALSYTRAKLETITEKDRDRIIHEPSPKSPFSENAI